MKYIIALVLALASSAAWAGQQSCYSDGTVTNCYGNDGDQNYEVRCYSDGTGHSSCFSNNTN